MTIDGLVRGAKKGVRRRALDLGSRLIKSTTRSIRFPGTAIAPEGIESRYPDFVIGGETRLCRIMTSEGSDKASGWHNYTKVYTALFEGVKIETLFEMGIGTRDLRVASNMGPSGVPGASLRAWERYLPGATIYGGDIDDQVLFSAPRIKTFHCDQTDESDVRRLWRQCEMPATVDVIVDDGLHLPHAGMLFFELSINRLSPNGVYIVEDIRAVDLGSWVSKIEACYVHEFPHLMFQLCLVPNLLNPLDNNLLIVRPA